MRKKNISLLAALALALTFSSALVSCGGIEVTDRMDVQRLWKDATGLEDYPQACLAVNSEFAAGHGGFIKAFNAALKEHDTWAENYPAETVAAINSHTEQGTASTVQSLTKDIVARCHIKAIDAKDDKAAIANYLGLFIALESELDESLVGGVLPDEGFYFTPTDGGETPETVNIYVPDGATALALAYFMHSGDKVGGANLNITVVAANKLGPAIVTGRIDMAVMPSNVAAKLYNTNGKCKLTMTLTHGNLYIVGGDMSGAEDFVGKRVGAIGRGQVPDLVLRYILKQKNIEYVFGDTVTKGKVTITYYENGGSVAKALKAGQIDFGLLAEPAASAVYSLINGEPAE